VRVNLSVVYSGLHLSHCTAMSGHTRNYSAPSLMSVRTSRPSTHLCCEPPGSLTDFVTGPALTFSQMLFITAQQLPFFITWDKSRSCTWLWLPNLKPRQVPISQYLLQVTTFASGTLLNNLVFAFSVPPTTQIVFRSAGNYRAFSTPLWNIYHRESVVLRAGSLWTGLAVSMLLGRFFMDKRYTLKQTVPHLLSLSPLTGHRHAC